MKIVIGKLFGKFDTEIEIDKELNILVGENGIGKSTILRICNYVLNNNYVELTKYYFNNIEIYDKKLTEPIVINHDFLFPDKEDLCEIIEEKDKDTEERDKLLKLINQLYKDDLLNEFLVYCYFDPSSSLSGKLENCLYKYASNRDKQMIYMKNILEDMRKENSNILKGIESFVNIDSYIKKDKNCYYIDFVENYKIENKFFKEGHIGVGILDTETLVFEGIYKYVYAGEDDENEILNIYEKDKFINEVNKNMKLVENYKCKNYKIIEIDIDNIINKLIKEKRIDINKLISYSYYSKEFINNIYLKINNLEEKYKDYYMAQQYGYAQSSNEYTPSIQEIQKIRNFYENEENREKIINYILPLMPKDSPYEFFITKAFSYREVNEKNYMFFRLYEIYNCIIENINNYKNERITKLEELLNKYIRSKEIRIKPTGIHIYDKEMDKNEDILKTNYDKNVELDFLSAGEKKIVILLTLGMFVEDSIFIIDEIENSLSIIWQENIINDLININKQNNLIIATQSAYALKNKEIQSSILFLPFEEV